MIAKYIYKCRGCGAEVERSVSKEPKNGFKCLDCKTKRWQDSRANKGRVRLASIHLTHHNQQRYDTVGDWEKDHGSLSISVSMMGNRDYEFLVGLHELIEAYLCMKVGVSQEEVDAFDKAHLDADEPGLLKDAPYRAQHVFATHIEELVASELGVDWDEYEKAVQSLVWQPRKV